MVDVDYSDFDPTTPKVKRERFILGYLGSVETLCHKGNAVLCQAVKKIKSKDYTPHSCILEVSDTGLRMVDRKKPQVLNTEIPVGKLQLYVTVIIIAMRTTLKVF